MTESCRSCPFPRGPILNGNWREVLELAVLAIDTVLSAKTGAIAQTANTSNPNV